MIKPEEPLPAFRIAHTIKAYAGEKGFTIGPGEWSRRDDLTIDDIRLETDADGRLELTVSIRARDTATVRRFETELRQAGAIR